MSLISLIVLLFITVWLTDGLVLFPLHLVHLPDLPRWLDWVIAIGLISWLIGE